VAAFYPEGKTESWLERLKRRAEEIKIRRENEDPYVKLARESLETYVKTGKVLKVPDDLPKEMLEKRAGVFVSIKKRGQLRGCIGTFMPTKKNIAEEIIRNAISAGCEDPRFSPVEPEELPELVYSVDVLTKPEPVDSPDKLDPKKYGVIVKKGARTGLLLPDLEGVDTVEKQLEIALRKAGIRPDEDYEIFRFEVVRHH
jgi:AmmeMemoRadiSam system protein A